MGFDILIVGAGFSGSVLAERFADTGKCVLIIDRRPHIGGNAFDFYHESGVLVHQYGPHIFHTNHKPIIDYLSRFTEWIPYQHRVLAAVDGQLVPIPINRRTLEQLYGPGVLTDGVETFLASVRKAIERPENAEDNVLSRMGTDLYRKFFKNYTEKQWGRSARELEASVTARIPIRDNYDDRYFTDRYQLMPRYGYSVMFQRILSHPNIHIMLKTEWDEVKDLCLAPRVIFTGPVDSFFNYAHGRLPYRSLRFNFELHHQESVQSVGTINYPNDYDFTRVTEFKHLTGQTHPLTVTVKEYPTDDGDPYYPVPSKSSSMLLEQYQRETKSLVNVSFAGRLGLYRYYNMDQAVASSLQLFEVLRKNGW